jgi:hypothetical protein
MLRTIGKVVTPMVNEPTDPTHAGCAIVRHLYSTASLNKMATRPRMNPREVIRMGRKRNLAHDFYAFQMGPCWSRSRSGPVDGIWAGRRVLTPF